MRIAIIVVVLLSVGGARDAWRSLLEGPRPPAIIAPPWRLSR